MNRVIYCGGRGYAEVAKVRDGVLEAFSRVGHHIVVHGGARGADRLVELLCETADITQEIYPAQWEKYGKSAGPIRNQEMADLPDVVLVVAFPGGPGTDHMTEIAKKKGIEVVYIS